VLELTEVVAEQAPPPPPAAPAQAAAPPPPPPSPAPTVADLMADDLALVSAPVAQQAASKFSDLASTVSQVRGLPVGGANRTLEDIVKELLRPMLKDWLDANLPTLVHRIVEREVAKLAGRVDEGQGR
jgi:cell pole-organizing protein PopZ